MNVKTGAGYGTPSAPVVIPNAAAGLGKCNALTVTVSGMEKKMNKTQAEHILHRLESRIFKQKQEFAKDKPTSHSLEEKRQRLAKAGFIIDNNYSHNHLKLPETKEHVSNKKKIDDYNKQLDKLLEEARDVVLLADNKDAMNILKEFTDKLASIQNAKA